MFDGYGEDDFVSDFAFLYASKLYEGANRELASFLVMNVEAHVHAFSRTSILNHLANYDFDGWADLFVLAAEMENDSLAELCIPHIDSLFKEKVFHDLIYHFSPNSNKISLVKHFMWVAKWFGGCERAVLSEEDMEVYSTALLSSKSLLQSLTGPEIDFLLFYLKQNSFVDALLATIDFIIAICPTEDEHSLIARMVYTELVEKPELFREKTDEFTLKADEYQAFLLDPIRSRQVLQVAISTRGIPFAFKNIVEDITKQSAELLNFGAVEMVRSYGNIQDNASPYLPFRLYNFTEVDPSYDNYAIFKILFEQFKYDSDQIMNFFPQNDKWRSAPVLEVIYHITATKLMPALSRKMSNPFGARRPARDYGLDSLLSFELDRIFAAILFLRDCGNPSGSHYFLQLIKKLAFHLPESIPSAIDFFGSPFTSLFETMGITFIERAIVLKSVDGALEAIEQSKAFVATALLKIYDAIPQLEFNDHYEGLPFFETILRNLYSRTEWEDKTILPADMNWSLGKVNLFKMAFSKQINKSEQDQVADDENEDE